MLSPLDENELAAAWRRAAGPDGKVPVKNSLKFELQMYIFVSNWEFFDGKVPVKNSPKRLFEFV